MTEEEVFDSPTGWVAKHIERYEASDGADGHVYMGVPCLLLTTRGRRTGKLRRTALMYGQDGGRYLLVASNGGSAAHPAWYLNLTADPDVRVQVNGERFAATARTATSEEKADLWPVVSKAFPTYDRYLKTAAKKGREIPLIIVERSVERSVDGRRTGGRTGMKTLSRRALNRATLARQLLLARSDRTVEDAVEHLVGLQAQTPHTWYTGLWTRLSGFDPDETGRRLTDRRLVRMALMRSTIHLVTARDAVALRPPLDPVVRRPLAGVHRRNVEGIDLAELVEAGRTLVDEQPRTFSELGVLLAARWPGRDPGALSLAVRALLPLVQVPPRGVWGRSGQAKHTSLAAWLPDMRAKQATARDIVLRYLGAFGPASVRDMQNWSGLSRLQEIVGELDLVTFRDEHGRELFDRPEAPRPDPDTPAPVRFLYDFDNLLLGHDDRSRVVSDAHAAIDFGERMEMPATFLIDGMTAGMWKCVVRRRAATMTLAPVVAIKPDAESELTAEAERLAAFLAPKAQERRIRLATGGWDAILALSSVR